MFSSKSMFFGWVTFVALAAAVFSATPATAELILYSDTFNRGSSGSPAALNGTAPVPTAVDQYGAKANATWTAYSAVTTDGLQANLPSEGQGANAGLSFTPRSQSRLHAFGNHRLHIRLVARHGVQPKRHHGRFELL